MQAKDYIEHAITTDLPDYEPMMKRLQNLRTLRLLHAAMGLCTEAGEFMDMIKKHILYGKDIDITNLVEELGDSNWYEALALDEVNVPFEIVFDTNIRKLKLRYPNKFTEKEALNRNLEAERKLLEERAQMQAEDLDE